MHIEKKGLKELVEKRLEIKEKLESVKVQIEKLTQDIKALQGEKTQAIQEDFQEVNEKINKLALLDVWNKLSDEEMPGEFIIKDGKPYCTIVNITEQVKQQAKETKEHWEKHLK